MHLEQDKAGPRERAWREGVGALGDAELVSLVVGTGGAGSPVSMVATALLDDVGGLGGLARAGAARIAARPGVGPVKALRVAAALELGRRAQARAAGPRTSVASSSEVAALLGPQLAALDHEELWLVALDGRNGARSVRRLAQGGLHGCAIAARDVLRVALWEAASAFVLVHNHPGGDPTPSPDDVAMSRTLLEASELVGVPLVDHVIVARGRHASLLDLGLLP